MSHNDSRCVTGATLVLLLGLGLMGACGGSGDSTAPNSPKVPDLTGTFFGREAVGVASCAPFAPVGGDFNPGSFTLLRVLVFSQSGSDLSATDEMDDGITTWSGTIKADGGISATERGTITAESIRVTSTNVVTARMTDSDGLSGTMNLSVEGRNAVTNTLLTTCTRPATLTMNRIAPLIDIPATTCDREPSLRFGGSTRVAMLILKNKTPQDLTVSALDQAGTRVLQGSLPARGGGIAETFVGRPFVVTDASGQCIAIYLPTSDGSARAVLR